jgi:hypothetical protein
MHTRAADLLRWPPEERPADVARGLDLLAAAVPLWPIDRTRWTALVDTVAVFALRWDRRARACGWCSLSLYGLHRRAPASNLAAMGGAWVLASVHHRAVVVGPDAIVTETPTGARLKFYRRPLNPAAVLAWSLCAPPAC